MLKHQQSTDQLKTELKETTGKNYETIHVGPNRHQRRAQRAWAKKQRKLSKEGAKNNG